MTKKILSIVLVIGALAAIGVVIYLILSTVNDSSNTVIELETETETEQAVIDSGDDLTVSDKSDISDSKLADLVIDTDQFVDHSSSSGNDDGFTVESDSSVHSDMTWKDGTINDDQLKIARGMAAQLYQNSLNEGLSSKRYVVEEEDFKDGDLSYFTLPVFYYVTNDGILYIQMRVSVYDLDDESVESRLVSIGMHYNGTDEVVLATGEE